MYILCLGSLLTSHLARDESVVSPGARLAVSYSGLDHELPLRYCEDSRQMDFFCCGDPRVFNGGDQAIFGKNPIRVCRELNPHSFHLMVFVVPSHECSRFVYLRYKLLVDDDHRGVLRRLVVVMLCDYQSNNQSISQSTRIDE